MRIAYRFFATTVGLLILYTFVSLIAALKFLPGDSTQTSLPFNQVNDLAAALLDLVVIGGLLGGGIYATAALDNRALRIGGRLWSLLVILTLLAGALNLLIAGGALLSVLKVIVIALVVAGIRPNLRAPISLVWTVGMVLSALCTLIGLIPTDDFILAARLHALASGLNTYVALVLAAVALAYWLMHRFSSVTPFVIDMSLYTVSGLIAFAGALVTLSTLGLNLSWLGGLSAILVPLLYLMFASHTYLAFSKRSPANTLAAHWAALGVLLLLLDVGILGGIQSAIRPWTAGTRLSDLQPTLALLAVVAILLGVINQVAAELRGQNRRVTGLAPFWLVAFGMVGSGFALAGAGLVQVYLERLLGVGFLDTQALLAPLYQLWILGLVSLALGVLLYAVILWLRRPRL